METPTISLPGTSTGTRVLGISSGKGGVGKSSVTVNLAIALSRLGHDVAILDADVYGFSIPQMLGVTDEPDIRESDGKIIPPSSHGVRCISIGFFVEEDKPVMWRGPMLQKALEQFLNDVEWSAPAYLLIDMPPGTGDVAMSMATLLPAAETFVVTTPQSAAQRVAQRSGALAKEVNTPIAGVIENMSWFTAENGSRQALFGTGGGETLAAQLEVSLLAQIPFDPSLREGGDSGVPIVVSHPESEAASAFVQLARRVHERPPSRIYREELRVR
jgi:ATP-binding protein involved in chromosome partitioning